MPPAGWTVPVADDDISSLLTTVTAELVIGTNERLTVVGIATISLTGSTLCQRGWDCIVKVRIAIEGMMAIAFSTFRFRKSDWTVWSGLPELLTAAGHGTAWDTDYRISNENLWVELQDVLSQLIYYVQRKQPVVTAAGLTYFCEYVEADPSVKEDVEDRWDAALGGATDAYHGYREEENGWFDRRGDRGPFIAASYSNIFLGDVPKYSQAAVTLRSSADFWSMTLPITALAGVVSKVGYQVDWSADPYRFPQAPPTFSSIPLILKIGADTIDSFTIDDTQYHWPREVVSPAITLDGADKQIDVYWNMAMPSDVPFNLGSGPFGIGDMTSFATDFAIEEASLRKWTFYVDITSALTYG